MLGFEFLVFAGKVFYIPDRRGNNGINKDKNMPGLKFFAPQGTQRALKHPCPASRLLVWPHDPEWNKRSKQFIQVVGCIALVTRLSLRKVLWQPQVQWKQRSLNSVSTLSPAGQRKQKMDMQRKENYHYQCSNLAGDLPHILSPCFGSGKRRSFDHTQLWLVNWTWGQTINYLVVSTN